MKPWFSARLAQLIAGIACLRLADPNIAAEAISRSGLQSFTHWGNSLAVPFASEIPNAKSGSQEDEPRPSRGISDSPRIVSCATVWFRRYQPPNTEFKCEDVKISNTALILPLIGIHQWMNPCFSAATHRRSRSIGP